jgi:hypothetical protein
MSVIIPASFFGNFVSTITPIINGSINSTFLVDSLNYSDGSSVIVGSFSAVNSIPAIDIAKLDRFGNLDTSKNTINFDSSTVYLTSIAQLSSNFFIAGTFTTIDGFSTPHIACLNENFSLNLAKCPVVNNFINSIDCDQISGKILACGFFTSPRNRIARFQYNISGNTILDTTFTPPTLTIPTGDAGIYKAIFAYNSSDITVCGNFVSGTRRGIMKLTNTGSVNTGFNANITSGIVYNFDYVDKTPLGAPNSDIIISGNIIISGITRNIARIQSNGTLVPSFNSDAVTAGGITTIFYESDPDRQNYGKILTYVNFDIVLLDGVTGLKDPTFNNNTGKITVQFIAGTSRTIYSIHSLGDDTYSILGDFSNLDGDTSKRYYARITYDGMVL